MNTFFTVENDEGERIDKYLSLEMPELSRSHIQKLIKDNLIEVNGKPVKANYRLCFDDSIKVTVPELKEPEIAAEDLPLDILYEDEDIIIVNKPKGMVVHPAPGHYSGTLVNALMFHCGDNLSGINGVVRPGIVHRIDMDTTGSLVVCKNDSAHQSLSAQLKDQLHPADLRGHCPRQYKGGGGDGGRPHRQTSYGPEKDEHKGEERKESCDPLQSPGALRGLYLHPVPAGDRTAPTRSVSTWPPSGIPCWETRSTARPNVPSRGSRARHCTPGRLASSIPAQASTWRWRLLSRRILSNY